MIESWARSITTISKTGFLALAILIPASVVYGQRGGASGTGRPAPGGHRRPVATPQPSIRERQFKILEMEREAAKPRPPEGDKIALAQIAEDFERIQVINNKMMAATMSAAPINYENIASTTAEIRKRANRIKDNLQLPKEDSDKALKASEHKPLVDAALMKAALLSLDDSIMSFIRNPIFKNTSVVNLEHAAHARRDLDTIIERSHVISKEAERLNKALAKSR